MREDYLWDKTGNDPEIENLENALQAFRYKETAALPAIPGNVLTFKREEPAPRRRAGIFSIRSAAACVAFLLIALGVWLQITTNKTEVAKVIAPQNEVAAANQTVEKVGDLIGKKPEALPVRKAEFLVKPASREIANSRKFVAVTFRSRQTAVQKENKIEKVRLTKEEQYAYNQLLLALSITGSQLKLVQDKIENVENQTAAPDAER